MNEFLDELRRDLESSAELGPSCLSVDTLGALAEGTLPPVETRRIGDHLQSCLTCLHRYAQLRGLLETPEEAAAPVAASVAQRERLVGVSWWDRVKSFWSWRLPVGWTVAASAASMAAATVVITTLVATTGYQRATVLSPPLTPLEIPGAEIRTVIGRIETIRDASEADVVAHVLRIREASGATYVLFAWGRPAAQAGDTVRVEGSFIRMEDEPLTYRGLAKRYEISRAPR